MRQFSSLALILAAALAPPAAADDPLLARYRGGELHFSEIGDPVFAELRGEPRSAAICAAAFREIYGHIGAEKRLDEKPELAGELTAARRRAAAEVYRHKRQPNFERNVTAAEIETEWQRRSLPGGDLYQPGQIDMDALYLRCGVLPAERLACRERAAQIDARLAKGVPFIDLVGEERERSGNANGSYSGAPIEKLSPDLRALAEATPSGLSSWLEAPHGLFRLQVLGRRGAGPRPLFLVEAQLRREIAERRLKAWEADERRRLDPRSKASCDEILAAAAEKAGDLKTPEVAAALEREKQRLLARRAFAADREARPPDAQLELELQKRPSPLEELVLLVFAMPFGEPKASYTKAGEIAEALTRGAADLPATIGALPSRFPGLRVEQLGPVRQREIQQALPEVARSLAGAAAGSWLGPIPLPNEGLWHLIHGDAAAPEAPGGRSLAFVAVLQRSVPPLAEVRQELLEPRLRELEAGGVACRELLFSRFALEILPADTKGDAVR